MEAVDQPFSTTRSRNRTAARVKLIDLSPETGVRP